ncbi:glycosyltransferase family 2 protein [Hydrogenophaga laconesensis]|uniref:GT2 family glycosyltransferase n=1 Tax=Hydrogenophaga laconesensis TaxID=1805971 RepID=A0ABU1V4G4_9BURK|nr:glycosyltransferase family A protein [Hydrogenophaga laconesensis]MDR7092349.1 GT2 family glycosyltransferase [Hydrogenophaga laconesensis]
MQPPHADPVETSAPPSIGAVIIGRNEGDRLRVCLASVLPFIQAAVYVDSGSTDGSVAMAQGMGADVLALDMDKPFTAARARNAGLQRLLAQHPEIRFVQFIDGDCEVVPGWIEAAHQYLEAQPRCAVVCGRRRERYPENSIYNLMCDREWDTPIGDALSCGGDALFRTEAITQVGGYRDGLIAGEEPELCLRLRREGWRVHRLDQEMTRHDAAIRSWRQWWQRTVRAGHAFAEGAWLHGAPPDRHWVRETRRAVLWGLLLPLGIALLGTFVDARAWLLALLYPLQWLRLSIRERSPAMAFFTLAGKFAEARGVLKFHLTRMLGRTGRLIEYK